MASASVTTRCFLNISRDSDSTIFLGNYSSAKPFFQWFGVFFSILSELPLVQTEAVSSYPFTWDSTCFAVCVFENSCWGLLHSAGDWKWTRGENNFLLLRGWAGQVSLVFFFLLWFYSNCIHSRRTTRSCYLISQVGNGLSGRRWKVLKYLFSVRSQGNK